MIFKKNMLASNIAMIVLLGTATHSWAQGTSSEEADVMDEPVEIEEVVVTGIRNSLTKAADYKRDYDGVVDAIVAEDMGKFPDGNLAEALSRLVGVAIDRSNIEGSKVAVRGFGPEFNLVTLNGRQMPTVPGSYDGGRSFDFGAISAHGFEAVQVFKTPTAKLPTGGIGSTINIITAKPLNLPGFGASFSAGAVADTTDTENGLTPEFDVFVTDTFLDDRLGLSFSGSHQVRHNREEGTQEIDWLNSASIDLPSRMVSGANIDTSANLRADNVVFFPAQVGFKVKDNERVRDNAQATMQFDFSETLRATVDYTYSAVKFESQGTQFGSYLGGFGMTSGTADENGVIVDSTYDRGEYTHTATWGSEDDTNKSLGLNLEWQASDALALTFDYHQSSAHKIGADNNIAFVNGAHDGTGPVSETSAVLDDRVVSYNSSGVPTYDFNVVGGGDITAYDMAGTNGTFSTQEKNNDLQQIQLDGKWENLDGLAFDALTSVEFGVSAMEQEFRVTGASNLVIQGKGHDGSLTVNNHILYDDSIFTKTSLAGFLDGLSTNGTNPEDYYLAIDAAAAAEAFATAGWGPDVNGYAVCDIVTVPAGTGFYDINDPTVRNDQACALNAGDTDNDGKVEESIASAYTQFNFETEIGLMPLNVTAGLRYEYSKSTSTALSQIASAIKWHVDGFEVIYDGATPLPISASTDYWLPNISFNLGVTDTAVVRLAASKTIARAGINDLRSVLAFAGRNYGDNVKANSGNPSLMPLESINFDFSYENYYAEGSYASVGYFRKDISGFLTTSTTTQTYGTLTDPFWGDFATTAKENIEAGTEEAVKDIPFSASELQELWWETMAQAGLVQNTEECFNADWVCDPGFIIGLDSDPLAQIDLTKPKNGQSGTVDGWELALQHQFAETGFGFNVNGTFVGGDVKADVNSLGEQFGLPGFGNSANLAGFYEDDKWQLTSGINYRAETYAGVEGNNNPIFLEARYQVDLTGSFKINHNFTVFAEARNVTDEPVRIYVRHKEMLFLAQDHGPMYKVGIRGNF